MQALAKLTPSIHLASRPNTDSGCYSTQASYPTHKLSSAQIRHAVLLPRSAGLWRFGRDVRPPRRQYTLRSVAGRQRGAARGGRRNGGRRIGLLVKGEQGWWSGRRVRVDVGRTHAPACICWEAARPGGAQAARVAVSRPAAEGAVCAITAALGARPWSRAAAERVCLLEPPAQQGGGVGTPGPLSSKVGKLLPIRYGSMQTKRV